MITFICLFFPSLMGLGLYEITMKKELTPGKKLTLYAALTCCINLICFMVKSYILGTGQSTLDYGLGDMTPSAACNYLVMAVPVAIFFAFFFALMTKHTDVRIEEDANNVKK